MQIVKFVFVGLAGVLAQEVHVLTKDNFDTFIKENAEGALVEFYAPWCGHCKQLEPEYNKAAEQMHEASMKAKLGKVDATVETELAQKHGVEGFPTLKWFVNGEPQEYDGPREADGIVTWIKQSSGPAVVEGKADEDADFSVTYFGAEASENFENLAKANRKKASWHFVKDDSAKKLVVKHKGEPALESDKVAEQADMESFFKDNAFPLFGALNGETFTKYMDRKIGMVWVLLKMEKDDYSKVVEENREAYTEVAKKYAGEFSVMHTNTQEFAEALDGMFSLKQEDLPALAIQKNAGDKKNFIYKASENNDAMDAASVIAYIEKVKNGEVEAKIKSEEAPEEPQEDPVKVVVGKTVETMVFSETKDVMFEVYAPWCGHCKKLEPEYNKVAKKVAKEGLDDLVTIAKMDGTANDSPVESLTWEGFPTMYYVKAGSKEPEKYEGERTAKGMWKWIKKNHSKADVIKERIAAKKAEKKDKKEEL